MRRHHWIAVAALWALGAASLAATSFWEAKAYTEWSPKEVEEILTDSPWARKISVVVPIPPRATDDAGGRGRGGDDGGGGRGFPIPAPQLKMVITWRSALPVRQAIVRSTNGTGDADANRQLLLDNPEFYLVTLSGVPARFSGMVASANTTSFLRRGRKMPIALAKGGVQRDGATLTLAFAFPRTDPISLDDKEVEFVTTLGTVEIRKKFALKELVLNGQLEL